MSQLGLDAAQDKCEGPTTRITWIEVLFDTIRLTMAIDPAKVEEARLFCLDLMSASSSSSTDFWTPSPRKSWFRLPRPPGQGRHSLVPVFPRLVQWGHTHQTFRCTARHPRGFLSTGRRRALLRTAALQDQLPTVPRGFRPLHFQSRMLESPCSRQDMAPHSVRYHSPSLLRQLGHSSSH